MDTKKALELLTSGKSGISEWNQIRKANKLIPKLDNIDLKKAHLDNADLSDTDLHGANLWCASLNYANLRRASAKGINLGSASLYEANLVDADLREANLRAAKFTSANLWRADLRGAQLHQARLNDANLCGCNLESASLEKAELGGVNLNRANLRDAILWQADLSRAVLRDVELSNSRMGSARCGWTTFADVDLASVSGLKTVQHIGPSSVGLDTLARSKGQIPAEFLRGCGLTPWQIELAKLHDPDLTCNQISELLSTKVFDARTKGPLFIGGVFISYSHLDSAFADKLRNRLIEQGAPVWMDRHDAVAGPLTKQIGDAIRLQDIVLLVLSKDSVESDWVENELEMARKKEKEEERDVLCPVALDDSWKAKVDGDPLWRQVKKKNVLDFSGWKTRKFGPEFQKLVKGMKIYYEPPKSDGR